MTLVWLIDDSDLEREVARRVLSKRYEVVEFATGEKLVEEILKAGRRPDVLVLDYHLPTLTGVEITRDLRMRIGPAELPVLILSSTHTASEDIARGLAAGANDYVLKPFSEIELLARVEALAQVKVQRQRADLAERSLRRLLMHLPDPFLAVDLAGRITFVNREAERILGTDWSALLSRELSSVIPRLGDLHRLGPDTPPFDVVIGDRYFEPAFGRLVIEEQLGETVTVTLRDVTEKVQAIARRDRFLAMLGHELRNPLAPILSAAQLLQRRGQDPSFAERASNIIHRQVERMIRIVDDLLDVSRVSRGRIEIRPEPIDVAVAVERAIESTMPLIDSRKHTLSWQRPQTPLWVHADPLRFEQMLTNLLTNAAKYTGERGHITVRAVGDEDAILLSVVDDGIGIAPHMLESIFELFVQADESLSRAEGGLGIGLPLVRQLAQMHGGTVVAHSEGAGRGSEFVLRLPAAPAPAVPARAARASAAPRHPRRVLLVDDNHDIAQLIAEALTQRGHEVRVAFTGPTAIEMALEFRPEVAFLDIGLPGCDGYEVARQVSKMPGRPRLIAVTGYGQPEDVARSREAGFDQHMVKPVTLQLVEKVLASLDPA